MDEDERFVRLNVDDDYEGGQWIGGEFFYRSKRQKTTQTKDQKIFGVFAGEDSSDEDRKGGKFSRKKEKMNYSKPVNFVSTGKVCSFHTIVLRIALQVIDWYWNVFYRFLARRLLSRSCTFRILPFQTRVISMLYGSAQTSIQKEMFCCRELYFGWILVVLPLRCS